MSLNELSKAEAKYELVLRAARSDFWIFRKLLHKRLKIGWWHREVSKALDEFYKQYKAGQRPRLVIEAPPQHGKSVIINDFVLWLIGKESDEDIKIIYAAFSDALSTRANRRIQRYVGTQVYQDVFPLLKITNKTQDLILFNEDGFFRNTTTGGAITGESMDIGVIDDPMKGREEANSATMRGKKWEWFTNDFSTRFSEYGAFLCILTRWHIDDPIGRLLESDKTVRELRYPAIAEHDEKFRKLGDPLFPEHKSLDFLNKIRKIMSSASWNSLYQQHPTIAEGNFFKPDMIPTVDAEPAGLKYCRAWDLAATENGGDYTCGVQIGYDSKTKIAYIIDVVRGQYAPEMVDNIILNTAKADGKQCKILIPQDPGQAGKSQARYFAKLLQGFSVQFSTVNGSKETRAQPVASQANVGNIYMLRASWNRPFIEELRLFPNGINDDQIDAFSDAYNHFNRNTGGHLY